MVVLNSTIGIFFKLPVCIIPLINVCADFNYKAARPSAFDYVPPGFGEFYTMFVKTELYGLIQYIILSLYFVVVYSNVYIQSF